MTTTIDSSDTLNINYVNGANASWVFIRSAGSGNVLDGTLSEVNGPASLVFSFHGTRVQVVGTVMPSLTQVLPPVSIYTLDGGTPVSFNVADLPSDASETEEQDGLTFYLSQVLQFTLHTLVVNVSVASSDSPYALDYIIYTEGSSGVIANTSSSLSTLPQSTTSSSSSTTSQSSTSSPSPTHSGSSVPVGAIAGGVVGGVVILAIALLAGFYFWHRRNQRREYDYSRGSTEEPPSTRMSFVPTNGIVPFPITAARPISSIGTEGNADQVVTIGKTTPFSYLTYNSPDNPNTLMEALGPVMTSSRDTVSQGTGDRSESGRPEISEKSRLQATQAGSPGDPSASSSSSTGQSRIPPLPPPSSPPEVHNVDSGLRFPQAATLDIAPVDAPPEYTPV